jgi:hypothetical protein
MHFWDTLRGVMQLHSILLTMNDKGITIEVYPFGNEQYPSNNLGEK